MQWQTRVVASCEWQQQQYEQHPFAVRQTTNMEGGLCSGGGGFHFEALTYSNCLTFPKYYCHNKIKKSNLEAQSEREREKGKGENVNDMMREKRISIGL